MLMVTLSWSGFTAGWPRRAAGRADHPGIRLARRAGRRYCAIGAAAAAGPQMPESVRFMAANAKHADRLRRVLSEYHRPALDGGTIVDDERPAGLSPISHLFIEGRAVRTLLLWAAFFCSLFVFYLLTSWLPTIPKTPVTISPTPRASERWCAARRHLGRHPDGAVDGSRRPLPRAGRLYPAPRW